MRIDRIRIRNFKCFDEKRLELNPRFTLLVGDNGAGKTSVLDALAVAAGADQVIGKGGNPSSVIPAEAGVHRLLPDILKPETQGAPRPAVSRRVPPPAAPVSAPARAARAWSVVTENR